MTDYLYAVQRLRTEAHSPADQPLEPETTLPRLYPVSFLLLPSLRVSTLRDYLHCHAADASATRLRCADRALRGGILATRGSGLIFADADDSPNEQRFTFAHETAHYLRDHLYPRENLLDRFGPDILPVLDGRRPPTLFERVDALLARADLALHTHLLDREGGLSDALAAIEWEADAFACELLAPKAALEARFPALLATDEAVQSVQAIFVTEFLLPDAPALRYARRFVGERGETPSLLHRLQII